MKKIISDLEYKKIVVHLQSEIKQPTVRSSNG